MHVWRGRNHQRELVAPTDTEEVRVEQIQVMLADLNGNTQSYDRAYLEVIGCPNHQWTILKSKWKTFNEIYLQKSSDAEFPEFKFRADHFLGYIQGLWHDCSSAHRDRLFFSEDGKEWQKIYGYDTYDDISPRLYEIAGMPPRTPKE